MANPRVFIGSSSEGLPVAFEIQKALEHSCDPTVWTQGIFSLTQPILTSLLAALDNHEYAVLVLTPDDDLNMRGQDSQVARDNVIFELGLFLGRYGAEKVFMVQPRGGEDFHLPTDLLGVVPATYNADRGDSNLTAALGPACYGIQEHITREVNHDSSESTPSYPQELIDRFHELNSRYLTWLISLILVHEAPSDFTVPDNLECSTASELRDIYCIVSGAGVGGDRLHDVYTLCETRACMTGAPVNEIEVQKFKVLLREFDGRLNNREREN